MSFLKKEIILDTKNMPKHIACIMDGNGRWAKKRGLPRTMGHKVGIERIDEIIKTCKELNIKALTVFAFSTENWKREEKEINDIFGLLENMIDRKREEFINNNIKVTMIGSLKRLENKYPILKEKLEKIIKNTENNTGFNFNIAFNYGSRSEIIEGIINIAKDVKENIINIDDIDEVLFEKYLMTKGMPNVDLMIRTSGECRLSNFLLWQLSYSELIFIKDYWPDFDSRKLKECIYTYQRRDRRFGNTK